MAVYRAGFDACPIDNTALVALVADPLVGTTIADQYAIDSCVGEGAMGRVYLAHHARLTKRRFAIKVLLGDLAADPTMRLRFGQEAEAASRLQHPNVVSVLDFGKTEGGLHYLVMDFIEGGSLCDRIDAGALSELDTIELTKQICLGLTHAHDQGLVHRDFKPDNVALVEHDGKTIPKILDFGLAIISTPEESSVRLTTAGLVVGTPAYVSPEQSQGHPVDHRTDLFALGVSIYEMLAGTLPFDGSVIDVLYKNATAPVPPIAERAGISVAPELEAIISKLTAKDAAERFSSAREVLLALEAIENPKSVVSRVGVGGDAAGVGNERERIETARTMAAVAPLVGVAGEALDKEVLDTAHASPQLGDALAIAATPSSSATWGKPAALIAILVVAAAAAFLVFGGKEKAKSAPDKRAALAVTDAGQANDVAKAQEPITVPALPEPPDAGAVAIVEVPDAAPVATVRNKPRRDKPRRDPTPTQKPDVKPEPVPAVVAPELPTPVEPVKPPPIEPVAPEVKPPIVQKPKVPTVFKAKTTIAAFESHGSLSDSKVKQPLKSGMSKLAACYETAARESKKNAALTVRVDYIVSVNGRIEKVRVAKTPLSGLSSCITKVIKKLRPRDRPDTGPQRVQFSLKYKPKQ